MEFEMTRPMLDFLIRLHKNGEDPHSMVNLIKMIGCFVLLLNIMISLFRGTHVGASKPNFVTLPNFLH